MQTASVDIDMTTAGPSSSPVKAYHLKGRCYDDAYRAAETARREALKAA